MQSKMIKIFLTLFVTVLFTLSCNFLMVPDANKQLVAHCDFSDYEPENWQARNPQNWELVNEGEKSLLHLKKVGSPASIRAPFNRIIWTQDSLKNFELVVKAKCITEPSNTRRDICLFFGYQDSLHYYYTHFSGVSDNVHNIIGIVNNSDRTKINIEEIGKSNAVMTEKKWYTLRIRRNCIDGSIKAYVNDITEPILTAVDTTFTQGKVGFGTFDDTAYFDEFTLYEL